MFAVGRFGNVVSDDSLLSVACFSFLSNILSICIATKRKNIGAGLRGCTTPFFDKHYVLPLTLAPSLIPSPHRGQSDGGGKCWKTLTFFQKPAFQSFSKFLEYLIKATASILQSSIDANLCLPPHPTLSWICSTLTETRQKACGLVVSFRSLSGLTSCRPSANPPPT